MPIRTIRMTVRNTKLAEAVMKAYPHEDGNTYMPATLASGHVACEHATECAATVCWIGRARDRV